MKKTLQRALAALIASGMCLSTWAAVTATLDKTRATVGERLRLVIVNTGSADQQPDTSALQQDFDVLGSQRGTNVQIANGHMATQTQLTPLLAAHHHGAIHIPPTQWGAEQSAPLELVVGAAADTAKPGANASESQVTMSYTLDQKQPYVQAAVVMSLRLNVGVQMAQASLDLQGNSDVLVKPLGQDQQHTEVRNGRSYQVIDRKYLLIPQRSGAISLKGPVFQAQVPDEAAAGNDPDMDNFFGNIFGQAMGRFGRPMRPVHLQANAIDMNVMPRPAAADASNWLPAQKLTLEESWRPDSGSLRVGEPLTRHLNLRAWGVTAAQLPDLASLMPVPDGIKKYPDQARNEDGLQGETLQAHREQDIALIASVPGRYVLPAMHLAWWDSVNHVQHSAELPERSLNVLPALGAGSSYAGVDPNGAPPAPTGGGLGGSGPDLGLGGPLASGLGTGLQHAARVAPTTPWLWVSAVLALLWLGTLGLWWRARRGASMAVGKSRKAPSAPIAPTQRNSSAALAALQRACSAGDARQARQHALAWAASIWPQSPPRGLIGLAERLGEDRFAEPLQQLDRACYTQADWSGQALAQAFARLPTFKASANMQTLIPDLYA